MAQDEITKEVEGLLSEFRVHRPPVPVERIARKLKIILCAMPAEDSISGAIIRKQGQVIIAVNPTHHVNRQRFTVAHELGHYFLHAGVAEHVDENLRVAWRSSNSSKAIDWNEVQANRFAAELLMPTRFMERDLSSLEEIDKRTVALLAKRYIVSADAMKIRLSQLGILGPF